MAGEATGLPFHRPPPRPQAWAQPWAQPWPRLWFFTDPERTPDPVAVARTLAPGAAVVYRHFGARDALQVAIALRRLRGLVLMIGDDPSLALRVGADGVHFPERRARLAEPFKRRHPDMIVTAAAHSPAALRRARGIDAAVLSPIFASRSRSAGTALGLQRAVRMTAMAPTPVIALGGLDAQRARMLLARGFAGVAGVDLFL